MIYCFNKKKKNFFEKIKIINFKIKTNKIKKIRIIFNKLK